ncbi:putative mitochondrial large ribosomal subunit protein [Phaeoacremonium minimum UCRPA7]|uniref:Putative mitochondrial large ribosomal subunit protein n=1 Tax=Phaeoacremonium minimum (strain UCR-PA7) TaxID=1286976 RepID=R8BJS0_PHAM7|nr:putative mitochondrial large ribosomal subunit protein [Phaeoacremonium minimum UCRPA7]EON99462.1 putative mitochondrial large ribosomal subunit protein [Phaeoacremonium minimum UCRPA7]
MRALAPTILKALRPTLVLPTHDAQTRAISFGSFFSRKKDEKKKNQSGTTTVWGDTKDRDVRTALRERMTSGRMESASIFADELEAVKGRKTPSGAQPASDAKRTATPSSTDDLGISKMREHMQQAVDPDARSRVRWERKMVIRHASRCLSPFGKETKAERIARTERASLSSSMYLPTSTKKLVHLAHQIHGKTVEDALQQMQFSKKKMAREVRFSLEEAKAVAVAERGMGLGQVNGEVLKPGQEVTLQTKEGKWLNVDDPTRLYIAEAWVGKGPWRGMRPDYRARGRMFIKKKPSTRIWIRLKEEKTRIREFNDRKAKEYRQGPWIHLPDRPVTAQRQHYSW